MEEFDVVLRRPAYIEEHPRPGQSYGSYNNEPNKRAKTGHTAQTGAAATGL